MNIQQAPSLVHSSFELPTKLASKKIQLNNGGRIEYNK